MENLKFIVDSALLRELGERLVEHVHYALVELVKNSYDADARSVIIEFIGDENGYKEIHIADDGRGMNFEEVKNYWMTIATTNKEFEETSRLYGRPKTGRKGIGRFCCRRLGEHLRLVTTGKNDRLFEKSEVKFPWNEFKPGTEVTAIECPGKQESFNESSTGTTLIISDLKYEWSLIKFNYIKRQLAMLSANMGTDRAGYSEDPGFNVYIKVPGLEGGDLRDLREDFIRAGWGTLTAYINDNYQAVCELDALGIGKRTITSKKEFHHLNDVSLKIGIFVQKPDQIRDKSVAVKYTLDEIIDHYGGVQIRFRGFRVYPYGDAGDDWLEIDRDRGRRLGGLDSKKQNELFVFAQTLQGVKPDRVLLNMLSMKSYFGGVDIGGKSTALELKANREGFLGGPAFAELKEFVRYAIDWSTIYRDYYLRDKAKKEAEASRAIFQTETDISLTSSNIVEGAVTYLEKEFSTLSTSLPEKERLNIIRRFKRASEAILTHEKSNREELRHLRLLASTSTLLLVFSHEVRSILGLIDDVSSKIKLLKKDLPYEQIQKADSIANRLQDTKVRFNDLLKMTSLIGVDSRKEKPAMLSLKHRAEKASSVFDLVCKGYGIEIDLREIQNNVMIGPIFEAELYSILLNLLSNSIKSVIARGSLKKIKLAAKKAAKQVTFKIMDTGIGLDPEKDGDIFKPFVSDSCGQLYQGLETYLNPGDRDILGTGSGLGLSIVKEIVSVHNGDIKILPQSDDWSAILEVTL